jgi:hypothetical protein
MISKPLRSLKCAQERIELLASGDEHAQLRVLPVGEAAEVLRELDGVGDGLLDIRVPEQPQPAVIIDEGAGSGTYQWSEERT